MGRLAEIFGKIWNSVYGLVWEASPGVPETDSIIDHIMNVGGPQTFDRTTDSLEALAIAIAGVGGGGGLAATDAGVAQIFQTTIDLHQAAATYDIATATTEDILIESITLQTTDDITDDAAAFTALTVQTDTVTEQEFIDNVLGAKANLDNESQMGWEGSVILLETDKIRFTIEGGTTDADPTTLQVVIKYRSIVDGGTLA